MDHQFRAKKASGAEGRKRRRLEEEEAKKLSKFFEAYLGKAGTSQSTCFSTLESEGGSCSGIAPREEGTVVETEEQAVARTEEVTVTPREEGTVVETEEQAVARTEEVTVTPGDDPNAGPSEPIEVRESQNVVPKVIALHDIGLLAFDKGTGKAIVPDALRTEIVKLGPKFFRNSDGPFKPIHQRSMKKSWFTIQMGDGRGIEVPRRWLVYSPSKNAAYCFCCLLFSRAAVQSTLEQECGFTNWKGPERLTRHDNGKNHRICFADWIEMEKRLAENRGLIDEKLQSQFEMEKQRWRYILKIIVRSIKYLAIQDQAFRGHRESLQQDDYSNVGNFLELMKLIADIDPVIADHLRHVESHPWARSYLSPTVQNEFIHLMASTVRQKLLRLIRQARYYGLILDSTPDFANREQLSEVVRYVVIDFERRAVTIKESFLGYILIRRKDAESLTEDILNQLEKDGMELQDCRSQCYDNAAVMAGHRSGVQQRIIERNHLATFVNCSNHSLNLVGVHAAEGDNVMSTFFSIINLVYNFFNSSTLRWEKLKSAVPVVVKQGSETRWSSRAEAVGAMNDNLDEILHLLRNMADDANETGPTIGDARMLYHNMVNYEFLFLIGFWDKVLRTIDNVQKRLQDPNMTFRTAAYDLKCLRNNFAQQREVLVSDSIKKGLDLCQDWGVEVERRERKKKLMPGESAKDAGLTIKEEMERVMKATIDRFITEMDQRFTRLYDTDAKFGFLLDIEELCYGTQRGNLLKKCETLAQLYHSDINGKKLFQDILDCRMLLLRPDQKKIKTPKDLLEFIVQYGQDGVFPNLRVAIQIMMTIAVSIASCERSFSKLKLIITHLRSSMGQDRLSDLALLSIERQETDNTDFDDIIDQFAAAKSRRVPL